MVAAVSVPYSMLVAFSLTVGLVLALSWMSLLIRGRLSTDDRDATEAESTKVHASLFKDKLRYVTNGPIAEFVVLLGTIAFVIVVFWLLLTR